MWRELDIGAASERNDELNLYRSGRDEMRTGERREEIVERNGIEQIDHCHSDTKGDPPRPQRVQTNGQVEQMMGNNAGRVDIVILGAQRRYIDAARTEIR